MSSENKIVESHCKILFYPNKIKKQVYSVYKVCSNWLRPVILLTQWQRAFSSWGLYCGDCHPPTDNWPPTLYLIGWREIKGEKCKVKWVFLRYRDFHVLSCPGLCLSLLLHHLQFYPWPVANGCPSKVRRGHNGPGPSVTSNREKPPVLLSASSKLLLNIILQHLPTFSRSSFFLYIFQFAQKITVLCLFTWGSGIKDIAIDEGLWQCGKCAVKKSPCPSL